MFGLLLATHLDLCETSMATSHSAIPMSMLTLNAWQLGCCKWRTHRRSCLCLIQMNLPHASGDGSGMARRSLEATYIGSHVVSLDGQASHREMCTGQTGWPFLGHSLLMHPPVLLTYCMLRTLHHSCAMPMYK
jgi:hypothetical protein